MRWEKRLQCCNLRDIKPLWFLLVLLLIFFVFLELFYFLIDFEGSFGIGFRALKIT